MMRNSGHMQSNLSYSHISFQKFNEDSIALMKKQSINSLELAPAKIVSFTKADILSYHKKFSEFLWNYEISVSSMQSLMYGVDCQIYRSKSEMQFAYDHLMNVIEIAKLYDCPHLVFANPKNRKKGNYYSTDIELEFFTNIAQICKSANIICGVEANPPTYGTDTLNTNREVIKLINEVNSEFLRWNFDLASFVYDGLESSFILQNLSLISNVHLSEIGLVDFEDSKYQSFIGWLRDVGYCSNISYERLNIF